MSNSHALMLIKLSKSTVVNGGVPTHGLLTKFVDMYIFEVLRCAVYIISPSCHLPCTLRAKSFIGHISH